MTNPTPPAPGGSEDPYARHRIRVIAVSGSGKITADSLQSWSAVSVTNTVTGDSPAFPASEVPSGVLSREPDGRETLLTVDGLRLELDGQGNASIYDGIDHLSGPGLFLVTEILQEEQQ